MNDLAVRCELVDLIRGINSKINRHLGNFYQPYGLTAVQALVLGELFHGGEMSLGELSERLGMGKSNLSPLCKRMEKEALVQRVRSRDDARIMRIRITPGARKTMEQILAGLGEDSVVGRLKRLDEEDRTVILKGLQKLNDVLE